MDQSEPLLVVMDRERYARRAEAARRTTIDLERLAAELIAYALDDLG